LKGNTTYLLTISNPVCQSLAIGKLGRIDFKRGFYLYVGSAKNGLYQRIERHKSKNKRIFWHIDYLLNKADIKEIWVGRKRECNVAEVLLSYNLLPVRGFGSSGCRCISHLFHTENLSLLREAIKLMEFKKFKNRRLLCR
jgi:sugar fermentation stimulation protein A